MGTGLDSLQHELRVDAYISNFRYEGREQSTKHMNGVALSTTITFTREDQVDLILHFYGQLDVRLHQKVKLVYVVDHGHIGSGGEVLKSIEFEGRPPIQMK